MKHKSNVMTRQLSALISNQLMGKYHPCWANICQPYVVLSKDRELLRHLVRLTTLSLEILNNIWSAWSCSETSILVLQSLHTFEWYYLSIEKTENHLDIWVRQTTLFLKNLNFIGSCIKTLIVLLQSLHTFEW